MQHQIDGTTDVDVPGDVVPDELQVAIAQVRDVSKVAGDQVVDAHDAVPLIEQCFSEVRSNEPGSAGNDYSQEDSRCAQ